MACSAASASACSALLLLLLLFLLLFRVEVLGADFRVLRAGLSVGLRLVLLVTGSVAVSRVSADGVGPFSLALIPPARLGNRFAKLPRARSLFSLIFSLIFSLNCPAL